MSADVATRPRPRPDASPRRRSGPLGVVLTLLGATTVLVAFTLLNWVDVYQQTISSTDEAPELVGKNLYTIRGEREVAAADVLVTDYVTWLGWTLLVAVTVAGVLAATPGPNTRAWRFGGVLVGVVGAVATWATAARLYQDPPAGQFGAPLRAADGFLGAGIGAHLAFAGFLVAGLGAALAPAASAPGGVRGWAARVRRDPPRGRAATAPGLAVASAVLLAIGFVAVDWYDALPFGSFDSYVDADPAVLVQAYFPALAYATAVAAAGAALVAAAGARAAPVVRWIALVAGVAGIVVTPWALALLADSPHPPFDGLWDSPSAGPFLVVAGYLAAVLAAVLTPPRRVD